MALLTQLWRLDGLVLVEAMDAGKGADAEQYRSQAKKLVKTLSAKSPARLTIESGECYFCYLIANDVCYLSLFERSYPKSAALLYLQELQREFDIEYGTEVPHAKRPYAFIKFDTFIQKQKKVYADTRAHNLRVVSDELADVHRVMSKNITDILGRGEKISSVAQKSDELVAQAAVYATQARRLNQGLGLRQWAVIALVLAIVALVVYLRLFWYA